MIQPFYYNNRRATMAIINITPDSFFKGSRMIDEKALLAHLEELKQQKVDIIDVGGYSTRPDCIDITPEQELGRLLPAIELIRSVLPNTPISIDTFRADVARECVKRFDVEIINDVSGGTLDDCMFDTIAELQKTYILMHMRGTPQTMTRSEYTTYDNFVMDVVRFFDERIQMLSQKGFYDIIIDPGFGFAKTLEQNFLLLKNLHLLKQWQLPILVGVSRKSMIYKTLNTTPEESLNGTTMLCTLALNNGANILRVHDVKEANETIQLFESYTNA